MTFCKKYVFLWRGVEEKGGKGDGVNPIPGGSNTSLPLKGSTDFGIVLGSFWDRFGIVLGSFWIILK